MNQDQIQKRKKEVLSELVNIDGQIDFQKLSEMFHVDSNFLQTGSKLGEIIVDSGLITKHQLENALKEQEKNSSKRIGQVLLELGYIDDTFLSINIALQSGLPFVKLENAIIEEEVVRLFGQELCEKLEAIPLKVEQKHLYIAVVDPTTINIKELSFMLSKNISLVVTTRRGLMLSLEKWYGTKSDLDIFVKDKSEVFLEADQLSEENIDVLVAKGKEAPIIELVNQIIVGAVERLASDIHIVPGKEFVRIVFRVNGILQDVTTLNINVLNFLIARIKILSGMNIVERRLPQDGRIHGKVKGNDIDIRVSTMPSVFGETAVMRMRYPDKQLPVIEELGFSDNDLLMIRQFCARTKGMMLITGPTGSGKSTSLASILLHIRDKPQKVHILTVEDPVEMEIQGITQIPINARIGLTFPRVLRNILRHDPDIIMIGEIRDDETAKIAIQAALTGHLVFSTLHTNDAIGTLERLVDMNVESYLVGSAINLILSQRLVKKLCKSCREMYFPDENEATLCKSLGIQLRDGSMLYRPEGCLDCHNTGYEGRVMIYELLRFDMNLKANASKKEFEPALFREVLKQKGVRTILQHGRELMMKGEIPLVEIMGHWEH